MNGDLIDVSIIIKYEYNYFVMRTIYILLLLSIIISSCTTIEVAKEVTKVTTSIKNTIKKERSIEENKTEKTENIQSADLSKEKEEVVKEKKKEKDTEIKQKKITTVKFIGKTLEELIKEFGEPVLVRKDGNTQTIRFDTSSCRLFIYFDSKMTKPRAEYYEIRNTQGNLIDKKGNITKCFKEIQKA